MPFKPLSSSNSNESNLGQMNDMLRELFDRDITQIFKDDTGTRRVLLGKGADGFYGLKVSQTSFDVYTAGNDDLAFNSGQNVFKIVATYASTLPTTNADNGGAAGTGTSTVTEEITHNLGYVPAILSYISFSGMEYVQLPITHGIALSGATGGFGTVRYDIAVDTTKIYLTTKIDFWAGSAKTTPDFGGYSAKIYLLQETAN